MWVSKICSQACDCGRIGKEMMSVFRFLVQIRSSRLEREKLMATVSSVFNGKLNILVSFSLLKHI